LYDRKFSEAVALFNGILEKNTRLVRPLYKKSLAEIESGDVSSGTEHLAGT
jgi:hypothetical protein